MFRFDSISTIYVSQKNGCDNSTGFYKENKNNMGPLKSIEKALEKIKEMRSIGLLQPITVLLIDDEYLVEKTIVIDEDIFNVTIESLNNTLLSGGFRISNFTEDEFNSKKCFSAFVPEIKEKNIWFTDLYVDNKRADFTSFPKDGFLTPESVENQSMELFEGSKWFIAKKEDITSIKDFVNFNDCFISYNHYWIDEHSPIETYDVQSGKIVFKYRSRFTIECESPTSALNYKIENVAETFEKENEWYLDRRTSKVYYIPRDKKQTPDSIRVYAPIVSKLFEIKGNKNKKVSNVKFRNLTFANTKGDYSSQYFKLKNGAPGEFYFDDQVNGYASDIQSVSWANGSIEFEYAHMCTIENCALKNFGVHGINIKDGCDTIRILNNDIFDGGAGGVRVNGGAFKDDPETYTHSNIISNNIITNCGKRYLSACGILLMNTYCNTVSNNEISYLYYTGISVGWVWGYKNSISRDNIIEKNHIHHIGQGVLSDMGGIYLLGKQPGSVVNNNIIHDVISKHYGGWGIYTDEGSSYITIENNICYNTLCNSYHQHYGCMNVVRNNIFISDNDSLMKESRPEFHLGLIFENNILIANNKSVFNVGCGEEQSGYIHMINSKNNLIYDMKTKNPVIIEINDKKYNLKEAQTLLNLDEGSIVDNPLFVDYENHNFALKENSPAYKIGFKDISTNDVGAIRN